MRSLISFADGPGGKLTVSNIPAVGQEVICTERFLVDRVLNEPFFNGRITVSADGPVSTVGTIISVTVGPKTHQLQVTAYGPYYGETGPMTVFCVRLS
jgi:hypothetical protein